MIVLKFGGAALADSKNVKNTISYIKKVENRRPVVVVSALKGITDQLITIIDMALNKDYEKTIELIENIKDRHDEIVNDLITNEQVKQELLNYFERKCSELETLFYSVSTLSECTKKSHDYIVSFGEKLSSHLVCGVLKNLSIDAKQFNGEELILTDSNYGNAYPNFSKTKEKIRKQLLDKTFIPIVTGFIGANEFGHTTTLGRGGSDYTASIIANCIDAKEVWFLKEVNGIMSADPKLVKNASNIDYMNYDEVAELSYFGAKVLHPIAIHPLRKKNIPAFIKNVYDFESKGTRISKELVKNSKVMKAVTCIKNVCLLTIQGDGMIGVYGIAARAFTTLASKEVSVLMISQSSSEQNICIVVSNGDAKIAKESLVDEFELEKLKGKITNISIMEKVSIISVVGCGMRNTPGISGKVFSALGDNLINIIMIAQGSSELNISCLIDTVNLERAVNCIHDKFDLGDEA